MPFNVGYTEKCLEYIGKGLKNETEVKEHMLVDDPEDFRIEWLQEMQ
jgi:hypothetical protein